MKYTEKYKINVHDADLNGILSPTGYMRYMQDCANCNMEEDKPSYDELFGSGLSFIVSRMKVVFLKELKSHDIISASTWAVKGKGVSFPRCYEIEKDGDICAKGKAIFALYDVAAHRLCRIGDTDLAYRTDEELPLEMPRIIKPVTEFEKVGEKTVSYPDVDRNRHMNNTVYADMFWSFIPDYDKYVPCSFDIFYRSEAKLGQKLEIFRAESENGFIFRSVREDDKINAEAEFTFRKLEK